MFLFLKQGRTLLIRFEPINEVRTHSKGSHLFIRFVLMKIKKMLVSTSMALPWKSNTDKDRRLESRV